MLKEYLFNLLDIYFNSVTTSMSIDIVYVSIYVMHTWTFVRK